MVSKLELPETFLTRDAASQELIASSENALNIVLPGAYVCFLRISNGGEGFVGRGGYLMLWPVEELQALNASYEVEKYAPGLLLFGSNGGGEAYGFDMRTLDKQIVQIPFVGMDWTYATEMGSRFEEFLERIKE